MASFTDLPAQFNPYIEQLPVEEMVKVGMMKQEQYQQGVQKIQSQIDDVAGLSILRDVDKTYLQSKLNELGSKLRYVAGADFSNFQLVNSVGGMTKQISKDPFVQAAVSSTAVDSKNLEFMEEEKKKGKLTPDNELNYLKQRSQYLKSGLKNDEGKPITFNGEYTPNFDVFKFAKETFDAVLPDSMSWDDIFQKGSDGKPVTVKSIGKDGKEIETLVYSTTMTRMEKEGRFPKKVQETLAQIFSDPRVSKQLNITGEYNYRNYDSDNLIKKLTDQKEELTNDYTEKLADLLVKQKQGEDVQGDIDLYQQKLDSINENYNNLSKSAADNPDAVRGLLYKEDINHRYVTMFGQIKSKQQVLANPAWQAQFDIQKEANAQSRWAQTEKRQSYEFSKDQEYKWAQLEQTKDLALLNIQSKGGRGIGVPIDVNRYEQGNQFADIDVVRLAEKDYDDAAINFTKSSTGFIWDNTGWGDIPQNKKRYNDLVKSGKTADEAKYTIIKEVADRRNISIEDFMATYTTKAVTRYNSLPAEIKEKNPAITDQYNSFKNSEKNWKNQSTIKKTIDDQTALLYGSNITKDQVLTNVKERTIKYNGKDWTLTKDDIYDLGLVLSGNMSVVGTVGGVDESVRKAGKQAEQRIIARGKGELVEGILYENTGTRAWKGGLITGVVSLAKDPFGIKSVYKTFKYAGDTPNAFKEAEQVSSKLSDPKFATMLKGKAEIIKKAYNITPNLKTSIFGEDNDENKNKLSNIKRWAAEYSAGKEGRINASSDFEDFRKLVGNIDDPTKVTLSAQPTINANGDVGVEIVGYSSKDLSRKGGMTIQPDEAIKLGIDINTIYETKEISTLRNLINYNDGKSSKGDPSLKSTYIQGDSYFDIDNFGQLKNSKYNVKGNVVVSGGKYYPYIYVSDGKQSKVRQLSGSPNLGAAVNALLEVEPTFVNLILNER